MKIIVKDDGEKELDIPNMILLNKPVIKKILKCKGVSVDDELIDIFIKNIKAAVDELGHFPIVEIIEKDGSKITIKL